MDYAIYVLLDCYASPCYRISSIIPYVYVLRSARLWWINAERAWKNNCIGHSSASAFTSLLARLHHGLETGFLEHRFMHASKTLEEYA